MVWQQLQECLEAFCNAWDAVPPLPALRAFLPASPPTLRWLALIELVKVDMERRWAHPEWRWRLEQYVAEFPELMADGRLADDLIYEEMHIRRQSGETILVDEYAARFPRNAVRQSCLSVTDKPGFTSALCRVPKLDEFEAGQCVDDFDLLTRLGRGAFGSVFLARQRSLGRLVALKIAADHGIETQTLAQLDHSNIVRVYDQRPLSDRRLQLIYMQYVPGGTLEGVVQRVRQTPVGERSGKLLLECIDRRLQERSESPPVDSLTRQYLAQRSWPETVCWLGARIAEALEHAHSRGVLHRDLKPANVLLAADGQPNLADFNVSSCAAVPGGGAAAFFGGSLAYMSPEQMEVFLGADRTLADSLDERSDLFTLGILMWELLTGQRPFGDAGICEPSPTSLGRLAARRRQPLDSSTFRSLPADCPARLIEVLQSLLQPIREQRPASADGVKRQFELCLRPDVERLARPQRFGFLAAVGRHPLPFLIVAAVVSNLVMCALNIAYNMEEILRHVEDRNVSSVFETQVVVINPIAYLIGIGTLVALAWPVVKSVKRRTSNPSTDVAGSSRYAQRSLLLGRIVALVSGIEWTVSGLVFPVWLQFALGTPTGLDARQYVHFFGSQAVCGLLAATMTFFLVTWYSLRALTPALVDPNHDDPQMWLALNRLSLETVGYTRATFAVVPIALLLMPLVRTESRWTFFALGLVGLLAWRLAYVMAGYIQRSIAALKAAVNVQAGLGDVQRRETF